MTRAVTAREARRELAGIRLASAEDRDIVDAHACAVWSVLAEPGDAIAGRLVRTLGAADALGVATSENVHAPAAADVSAGDLARARARWSPRLTVRAVHTALSSAAEAGVGLVTRTDPAWPAAVEDLGDHAPLCLWVRGDAGVLDVPPAVAVVGARAATSYGEHVAMELAADLAGAGVVVVSGGAYGVDGAAHRAALGAGGRTVALSAGGVDRPYPAGHADLFGRIARAGAIVAEVPCGAAPTKWRFLQRNRCIAALAGATVVVEAGWRSGSLNTAGHAAALGRPLGAVPGPITSAGSSGTHRLIREFGAECITGADDVRELLGLQPSTGAQALRADGIPDATRVRDALSTRAARTVDDVAARSGMDPAEVAAVMGLLELEGAVGRTPDGWRLIVGRPA